MNGIIEKLAQSNTMNNKTSRYNAYREAIAIAYGYLGFKNRKRVGWCFENVAKTAFPSAEYTGFRNAQHLEASSDDESTDDQNSITDL